jgi:hypothetical protein
MKRTSRTAALAILIAFSFGSTAQAQAPIFVVHSDEFWLNLHHFLFVLGQAQGRDPGTLREAVQNAPADAQRGLETLTPDENDVWSAAVTTYADGLSQRDPVQDEGHALMIATLAAAGDSRTLRRVDIDSEVRTTLESVAAIYRKTWWPTHRGSNEAFDATLQPLIAEHGPAIRDFLTARYALPWPSGGYPVHLSPYSTWAGAYSTYGNLLVVATNEKAGYHGLAGLEMSFHEAMHQWDEVVLALLRSAAPSLESGALADLSHSLIFYTAGEAVRRVVPEHVPFAERIDMWRGPRTPVHAALDEIWKPFLDGRGTRDAAMTAFAARIATPLPAAVAPPTARRTPPVFFTFETDEFWLNLHHFLYVLGRLEAGIPEQGRPSNVNPSADAERGLQTLTVDDRRTWAEAVHEYATGFGLQPPLAQSMSAATRALADVDAVATLAQLELDAALAALLERAAPIYRKTWWPAHLATNRAWHASTQALLDRHGAAVIDYVTRAYALQWPAAGFAVHVSSYANFGIAYSSGFSGVLVIPSSSNLNAGLYGLETIVHEAMHQWDGQMFTALRALAEPSLSTVPQDLPHALIFYTAGQAVRRVEPAHVPMADALDIWALRLSGATLSAARLKPLLEEIWQPRLEGRGARDDALAALMARAGAASQP